MAEINIATIGFTKTTAESFFSRLADAQVVRVIDVRLHNTSQLSGFAKSDDLAYFLKSIAHIKYQHEPLLAPTDDILKAYKKEKGNWQTYEDRFIALMEHRQIEKRLDAQLLHHSCLLCSEAKPHHCHRRLVCEYLNRKWNGKLAVRHL